MSKGEWPLRFSEVARIVVFAIIFGSVLGIASAWLNVGAWLNIGPISFAIIGGGVVGAVSAKYLVWIRKRRKDLTGS